MTCSGRPLKGYHTHGLFLLGLEQMMCHGTATVHDQQGEWQHSLVTRKHWRVSLVIVNCNPFCKSLMFQIKSLNTRIHQEDFFIFCHFAFSWEGTWCNSVYDMISLTKSRQSTCRGLPCCRPPVLTLSVHSVTTTTPSVPL